MGLRQRRDVDAANLTVPIPYNAGKGNGVSRPGSPLIERTAEFHVPIGGVFAGADSVRGNEASVRKRRYAWKCCYSAASASLRRAEYAAINYFHICRLPIHR
jgi:hypothetical protein